MTASTTADATTVEHCREAVQASMDRRDNGGEAGH